MKILFSVTFRSFDKPLERTNQIIFLKSLNKYSSFIDIYATQFGEKNIKGYIKKYFKGKIFFKELKNKKFKWSHSIVFSNGLKKYIKSNYDYICWSSSDLKYNQNVFNYLIKNLKKKNKLFTYFPNISTRTERSLVEFGLDTFFFKINKIKAKQMILLLNKYPNYDWGMFEHYLFSLSEIFDLEIINMRKYTKIIKFENSRSKGLVDNQILSWKKNKLILEKMLIKKKVSILFSRGSMYYLALKLFSLKHINLNLLYIYILLLIKLIFRLIKGRDYR